MNQGRNKHGDDLPSPPPAPRSLTSLFCTSLGAEGRQPWKCPQGLHIFPAGLTGVGRHSTRRVPAPIPPPSLYLQLPERHPSGQDTSAPSGSRGRGLLPWAGCGGSLREAVGCLGGCACLSWGGMASVAT